MNLGMPVFTQRIVWRVFFFLFFAFYLRKYLFTARKEGEQQQQLILWWRNISTYSLGGFCAIHVFVMKTGQLRGACVIPTKDGCEWDELLNQSMTSIKPVRKTPIVKVGDFNGKFIDCTVLADVVQVPSLDCVSWCQVHWLNVSILTVAFPTQRSFWGVAVGLTLVKKCYYLYRMNLTVSFCKI